VPQVIQKQPEIRRTDNETVMQNLNRCAEIILGLKPKTDVLEVNLQRQLNTAETGAYSGIEGALSVRITREIKQKTSISIQPN
jgi:hypothetical protein